jgi:hypothetical protein
LGQKAGKSSTKSTQKTGIKSDRGWFQVAGPIPIAGKCVGVVPDGQIVNGVPTWKGGEYERIEAKNRAALKAHFEALEQAEVEANGYFTDPEWREVVSPDGVKCFVTRWRPA